MIPVDWSEGEHGFHCNPFHPCGLCERNAGFFGAYGLSGKIIFLLRAVKNEPLPRSRHKIPYEEGGTKSSDADEQ